MVAPQLRVEGGVVLYCDIVVASQRMWRKENYDFRFIQLPASAHIFFPGKKLFRSSNFHRNILPKEDYLVRQHHHSPAAKLLFTFHNYKRASAQLYHVPTMPYCASGTFTISSEGRIFGASAPSFCSEAALHVSLKRASATLWLLHHAKHRELHFSLRQQCFTVVPNKAA